MAKNANGGSVMDRITAIGRIRIEQGYTEADAAAEVKATFGEGGNPQLDNPNPTAEEYLGFVNTPMTKDGYIRCSVKEAFGVALDYIKSIGGATTIELIQVEHDGQKMYQVGTDPTEWLGMINGVPMYIEPIEEI